MKEMDGERPHRSGSNSSELFICFTSRASSSSSSSMKISSKSILSPGRTDKFRDGLSTLPPSLSRRLRCSGSMKGGQSSPMFPAGSKKKGCAFDTPEPSSPKVTCIGQVRVKTKKQGKKMRSRSKRRGEVSFRRTEQTQEGMQQECLPSRNQRWVHLPLSICEALRAFGAEFNCFLPCGGRSSCSSNAGTEREKGEKSSTTATPQPASSCAAVFARWLMVLQESEEERRETVEGIVGLVGEEEEENVERKERREEAKTEEKAEIEEEEEEEVSICIPPRNALLLMRCRSEPFRMTPFATRFWESPAPKEEEEDEDDNDNEEDDGQDDDGEEDDDDEDEEEEEVEVVSVTVEEKEEEKMEEMLEKSVSATEEDQNPEIEEEKPGTSEKVEVAEEYQSPKSEEEEELKESLIPEKETTDQSLEKECTEEPTERENQKEEEEEVERELKASSPQAIEEKKGTVQEDYREEEGIQSMENQGGKEEVEVEKEVIASCCTPSVQKQEEEEAAASASASKEAEAEADAEAALEEEEHEKLTGEKEKMDGENEISVVPAAVAEAKATGKNEKTPEFARRKEERDGGKLPDCLLMMMCEPKLSMEVSKETWVCSTDFLRCRPTKPDPPNPIQEQQTAKEAEGGAAEAEDSNPAHPPRPAPVLSHQPASMATVIEQKLINAVAYEPFVLTRCKSEPMRSSTKLAPEACFWKSRKLPHVGVSAAGVGF